MGIRLYDILHVIPIYNSEEVVEMVKAYIDLE